MDYPIASFEEDQKIDIKMGPRTILAWSMMLVHAVAAWYENGHYYFILTDISEPVTAIDLAEYFRTTERNRTAYHHFMALDHLAQSFGANDYPPSRPLLDPIYFGA